MALAMVAVVSGVALRDPRPRMCLAFGHRRRHALVWPGAAGVRLAVSRAHAAAGDPGRLAVWIPRDRRHGGPLRLRGRDGPPMDPPTARWRTGASIAILAAPRARTAGGAGLLQPAYRGIPRIYDRLALERDTRSLIELPLPMRRGAFFNAPFMLNSTAHWKPMVNGCSGFVPDSYVEHYNQLDTFPAPETIAVLQQLGVTHAFVRLGALRGTAKSADLDQHDGTHAAARRWKATSRYPEGGLASRAHQAGR